MYDVSVIRRALGYWLQIRTQKVPRRSKRVNHEPLDIHQSIFILERHTAIIDLLHLDASAAAQILDVAVDVCLTHLQFLAFHQPFLRLNFKQLILFCSNIAGPIQVPLSEDVIDPLQWFLFELICHWIEFDADNRTKNFETLIAHVGFTSMTNIQLACVLRHPFVRANSSASIMITDAFVSRSRL
jgi:hypothetical protein